MGAEPMRDPEQLRPPSLRHLPGAIESCTLLTAITVLLAINSGQPRVDAVLRPLYFALLFAFFHRVGRRYEPIRGLPMRLVQSGFLVLTLGFSTGAVVLLLGLDLDSEVLAQLRSSCERGAVFLLGTTLLSYGLMLWIPQVLESHRRLRASFDRTRGALHVSELARNRMELRLIEADRLSLLGELAAGVAHDLRNPLAILRGTAESLSRKPRHGSELQEHVDVIRRSIDKADRTIQALIGLGRPRQSQRHDVGLDEVMREVLALVQLPARRRHQRCQALDQSGVVAVADRDQLIQALLNLLLNALHASPDGGVVVVRARQFHLRGHDFAALLVEDRGHGLPPEVQKQLFTPFFTTRRDGTGLGLLSSRRIAMELGGQLELRQRTGGGARAVMVLPAPSLQPVGGPR